MKQKIFWNMCYIALAAVFLSAALLSVIFYRNLEQSMRREVTSEAKYIQTAMELSGEEYLTALSNAGGGNRITWIGQDGSVLYDNANETESMENHSSRPEIESALKYGAGESTRISDTMATKTFYYAVRLQDGSVLRVSNTADSVFAAVLRLVPWMALAALLVMALAMVLAEHQTKAIVSPINDIDLEHPDADGIYDELSPLVSRLQKQQATIADQMNLLKQKQREFSMITEHMSEGFVVVDKRAEVVSYNSAAAGILGIDPQQIEEEGNAHILNFNRSSSFRHAVDEAMAGRHAEQDLELNGRWYQMIVNPVFQKEKCQGAIIIVLDITEKREREHLRREFSANVSHELKTPLTSISGYAEIMKSGLVKPEDMGRFAGNIYTEAQRLITLVGDIIRLSQLDEEKMTVEKQETDLYQMCAGVMERLDQTAKDNQVTVTLSGSHETVLGAPQILDEMIYNLCENAIKYNRPGGSVQMCVERRNGQVRLTVTDTGIGIPQADQERVFERFYRVDKSHSKQIGGTGLGLSIVKHGAIYHNAQVHLTSKEGEGTSVEVVFAG